MQLRRLNREGSDQFAEYLAVLRSDARTPFPRELVDDQRFTEALGATVEVDDVQFVNKFEAGQYLAGVLSPVSQQRLRSDAGLWSWLAGWFFDQLCPTDGRGRRKPRETSKYIPQPGDHRYGLDKHLLFFPWKMFQLHGRAAEFLLSQALPIDSRAQREWTGYYHNLSTDLIELCRMLYWDEERKRLKRGTLASPKGRRRKNGGLRRFVQVAHQLEVTYDLFGMSASQILALLPRDEFGRWSEMK